MALHTLRGGSSKDALNVTALTIDLSMAAGEREAGGAVIDFNIRTDTSLGRHGIRHEQHRAAYRQKPGNNCRGKEPMSRPTSQAGHSCISLDICHGETSLGCATFIFGIIIPNY